jgi:hypothetical protein
MSPRHRRYLLLDQGVGSVVVNLAVNAAIAWLLFRGATTVPLWGSQSIAGDTLATAFLLPFLSTLIASAVVRGQVRSGYVPRLSLSDGSPLQRLPAGLAGRGAVLGGLGLLTAGLPTAAGLDAIGVADMAFGDFVLFKAVFAAALGAVVTPVIARVALADVLPVDDA